MPAAAQDGTAVIAAAAKAMGADTLNSISYYGAGANFNLGQSNNANGAWPRTNVSDYVALDRLHAARVARDGRDLRGAGDRRARRRRAPFQQNITPANTGWAQQLEIWITPWGFLKGAAANNATAEAPDGRRHAATTS